MQESFTDSSQISSCFQAGDSIAGRLSGATPNGAARNRAMELLVHKKWENTAVVAYHSAGKLLIIDQVQRDLDRQRAITIAGDLADTRPGCTVLLAGIEPDSRDQVSREYSSQKVTVVAGRLALLNGFMGRFSARLDGPGGEINLARLGPYPGEYFDLVLDLGRPAYLQHEVLPPGYYAPGEDPELLRSALQEIPQMQGGFGKPVYVKYLANICTHGGKGITGCTSCLAVCPADAIREKGEKIEVHTSLCQGCGACISACPTGALSGTFPDIREWLILVRDMLAAYRNAGGSRPELIIYDARGDTALQDSAGTLPDNLIPVPVEEIGSAGMDAWLSTLAYGAGSVTLLIGNGTPQSIRAGLRSQFSIAHGILTGMGYSAGCLRLVELPADNVFATISTADISAREIPAAGFNPFEKHRTIRLAVSHLYRHAPAPRESAALPDGSSFGTVQVDHDTCTLCMSCVSICPVQALHHDAAQLQLGFLEMNCVQCGLCRNACPEGSITLVSRYVYDDALAAKPQVLNEDEPFRCIACGKPFISRHMFERITEKLAAAGNWQVDRNSPPEWLQMCGDCRTREPQRR